jgi:hypothetical protein
MHAAAVRMASRAVCFCVAVSVVNMVSVEMDAGNEKPRTGAGAGSLIESGLFLLRASSSRTCGFGNKHEYEQRRRGDGRGAGRVGGGVALQHGVEITTALSALSSVAARGGGACGRIVRKGPPLRHGCR